MCIYIYIYIYTHTFLKEKVPARGGADERRVRSSYGHFSY